MCVKSLAITQNEIFEETRHTWEDNHDFDHALSLRLVTLHRFFLFVEPTSLFDHKKIDVNLLFITLLGNDLHKSRQTLMKRKKYICCHAHEEDISYAFFSTFLSVIWIRDILAQELMNNRPENNLIRELVILFAEVSIWKWSLKSRKMKVLMWSLRKFPNSWRIFRS